MCKCGAAWTGYRIAHCGGALGCHVTFGGITFFDRHLIGGRHHTPQEMELEVVRTSGDTQVWGQPMTQEAIKEMQERWGDHERDR